MSKVLIVDDEEEAVEVLERYLTKLDYEVLSACDGQEGLRLAKQETPDLILLDLMLPKMDGYKVCALLKSDLRYKEIPIIICSGRASEQDKDLVKDVGGDAYLVKPIDLDILIQEIEKLLP